MRWYIKLTHKDNKNEERIFSPSWKISLTMNVINTYKNCIKTLDIIRLILRCGENMPKIFEYLGIIIMFYSNEHEPIHVHGKF